VAANGRDRDRPNDGLRERTSGSGNGGLDDGTGGLLTQFDNPFINDQRPDVFP
jgi:hypothetical protein